MVILLGGAFYVYLQIDHEIQRFAEKTLQQAYPHLDVRISRAELVEGQGIEIRGLHIASRDLGRRGGEMIEIERVMLECDAQLPELLHTPPRVRRILIERPRVRGVRDAGGDWNLAELWPLPKLGDGADRIEISAGVLEFTDHTASVPRALTLRCPRLVLEKRPPQPPAVELGEEQGQDRVGAASEGVGYQITALFESSSVDSIEVTATGNPLNSTFEASGTVQGFTLAGDLLSALPREFHRVSAALLEATCRLDMSFRIVRDATQQLTWNADIELSEGRVTHRDFAIPLRHVEGQLHFDDSGVRIEYLSGEVNGGRFAARGQRQGWAAHAPLAMAMRIERLTSNAALFALLPSPLTELWDKYRPEGPVDVEMTARHDGLTLRPEFTVRPQGMKLLCDKFPYPVDNARGEIRQWYPAGATRPFMEVDLTAVGAGQPITIRAEIDDPGANWTGQVDVSGDNLVVDRDLIAALEPKTRAVAHSLRPAGRFNVRWRASRDDPRRMKARVDVELSILDGSVRYEKFAYPLREITGQVTARDGRWEFRDLKGMKNDGVVECSGTMQPGPQGKVLDLNFWGHNINLEADLRDAFNPQVQLLWDRFSPQGRVDFAAAVRYQTGQQPVVAVTVEPRDDTVAIVPEFFPYRLELLEGTAEFRDGHVVIDQLRARHNATEMSAHAECRYSAQGDWSFELRDMNVDRLLTDRELPLALPSKLRELVAVLRPTGGMRLYDSRLRFARAASATAPVIADWKLNFDFVRVGLDCGLKLENVFGGVTLEGEFDGQRSVTRGQLAIDSVMYKNLQFTNVRGPLWTDAQEVLIGRMAAERSGGENQVLSAKAYGGTIYATSRILLGKVLQFALDAALTDGDVARVIAEFAPGSSDLEGRLQAQLYLEGRGVGEEAIIRSLKGHGRIQLVNADIYELPQMTRLLRVVRARRPENTGFSRSDMHYRILGDHVYFDQIEFIGDVVSLYGKGDVGFDRQLNLSFQTVVGRIDSPLPLISQVVREASAQVMMLHVTGPIDNPVITKEPLPGLNQALQRLQEDLDPSARQPGPAATRQSLLPFGWLGR